MGDNVHDLEIGGVVVGEGHIVCGNFHNCLAGQRQLCAATKEMGVNRPGAFAEYCAIPASNVWRAGTHPFLMRLAFC
jgi:threonine 3-dehydrogenase